MDEFASVLCAKINIGNKSYDITSYLNDVYYLLNEHHYGVKEVILQFMLTIMLNVKLTFL